MANLGNFGLPNARTDPTIRTKFFGAILVLRRFILHWSPNTPLHDVTGLHDVMIAVTSGDHLLKASSKGALLLIKSIFWSFQKTEFCPFLLSFFFLFSSVALCPLMSSYATICRKGSRLFAVFQSLQSGKGFSTKRRSEVRRRSSGQTHRLQHLRRCF